MFNEFIPWEERQAMKDVPLTELFKSVRLWKTGDSSTVPRTSKSIVGNYLAGRVVDGRIFSLFVEASDRLKSFSETKMFQIDYDSRYFEAVVWKSDQVLLLIKYNQILGSRCLRVIPLAEFAAWCGLPPETFVRSVGP